jgi:hypothetical protein
MTTLTASSVRMPDRSRASAYAAVIPLLLVNLVAVSGQLAFLRDHLSWGLPGDLIFAAALESVAIYLAYHAHVALVSNDSATRLRLASYAFGLAIGVMNYSHYAGPNWRPTFEAVAVGLMSASSPWLWAIHSRRASRAALMAAGLVEPHALRLGVTRWAWHPVRSFRVMHAATWSGIQSPAEAIAAIEPQTASARAAFEHRPETLADQRTLADAIRFAMAEIARTRNVDIDALSAREIADYLHDHAGELADSWNATTSYISDVLRRTIAARDKASDGKVTHLPRGRHSA